ncbi:aminotransferase class I/II-fold pyridoxal phosphate-dependent enzyme [Zhihengliuella sp.]|uniref:aminotransferase class I/II-fold pyridoxal phosphate-dependent enzyme n=1 Tax=Zhihengliuella sp. TaxID=1954483 RepID=UPI0028120989|nr:aminotransferase class I/II-fold pyridoxal phosphate-dependent enzyme [Zhihengliuella sp.]
MTAHSSQAPWQRAADAAGLLGRSGAVAPTVFEELTALANRYDAINLGQGFPDSDGPAELRSAAQEAIALGIDQGGLNQYAPGIGLPELRTAVAEHQRRFYGRELDPQTEVLATTGATEGIAATILALVSAGDRVVTLSPFYDSYAAMIGLAGGTHATIPLRWPDFQPRIEDIEQAITPGTRLVVVNTPHNPTGTIVATEALEAIVQRCLEVGAWILSDEVYEHLVFEGAHVPVATLPDAADITLTAGSAGKSFSLTGWKVGWLTGPRELVTAARAVKQFLTYSSGGPFQRAVARGLGFDKAFFLARATQLQEQSRLLGDALTSIGLDVNCPAAGYFLIADTRPLGVVDARELAYRLPEALGVAAIPVTAFVHPQGRETYAPLLRFAFCKRPEVLAEAAERLQRLPEIL